MILPLQAAPYLRLAKRALAGRGSLESAAYKQDILCPEKTETVSPAIFLPGQLDRVLPFPAGSTREQTIAGAISTTIMHPPTIACHLKNAVLLDDSIYVGRYKHAVSDKALYASGSCTPVYLKSAVLASTFNGTHFFGHWLKDDCTQYILAKELGVPLCLRMPKSWTHQRQYQDFFAQDWTPTDRAWIDNLIILKNFDHENILRRKNLWILRERIKAYFPDQNRGLCVYLKRGATGAARLIEREEEILGTLTKHGFVIVDISSAGLEHILETVAAAKLVVSIEGSQIDHCAYAHAAGSGLLVLQPADRFSHNPRAWTNVMGVKYGFVVGLVGETGYRFSATEILRTADLMFKNTRS